MKSIYLDRFGYSAALAALLCLATITRLILIFKHGHVVHSDGSEYFMHSQQAYNSLMHLDFKNLIGRPVYHWGGVLFGILPFFIPADQHGQERLSAAFFAIPAVLNIWLIYRVALKTDCEKRVAFLAAFLYTFSFATIYQVRFVLPHKLSIGAFKSAIFI